LDEASAIETLHPYIFYGENIHPMVTGGTSTRAWAPVRATGGSALPSEPAKVSAAEK
jgi:hypothetical protein